MKHRQICFQTNFLPTQRLENMVKHIFLLASSAQVPSLCGHQVFSLADAHFYSATKYAVTALTEGLRQELRAENTHIRATCISPGVVETEFMSRFYNDSPEKAAGIYAAVKPMKAIDVASAVTYVLSAPPHVQIGDIHFEGV
uniref:Dehydrogenase/reductase (SDR family) member 11b n=1 Tax=Oreochromis aureus TaxID=47969 RepID=A0AAZ1WXA9_OREAU